MPRRRGQAAVLSLLVAVSAARADTAKPALPQRIASLVGTYEAASRAIVGLCVVDLRTGRPLAAARPDEQRTPASNQKLLTGAAALAKLGGSFKFTTAVCLSGKDIVLLGDGDPMLGDPRRAAANGQSIYHHVDLWAAAIRRKAGAKLAGDILVVRRVKAFRHPDWSKSQYVNDYCAPVASLNFHNNCYDVTFRVAGGAARAVVVPQSRFIRVVGKLAPGKSHLWSLRSTTDESSVTIRGTVRPTSDPYSAPVSNPPLLLGRILADRIETLPAAAS